MLTRQLIPTLLLILSVILSACTGSANPPTPASNPWVLTEINGQPVLPGSLPTLRFESDRAGGNGSCNGFGGEYTLNGDQLTFGPLVSTLMACMEPGVMEQESAYLAALQATTRYQIKDGRLQLLDASGAIVLVFDPQDMNLQGKTWQLSFYNDGSALVSVLENTQPTLVFDGETVRGSGGCNQFSGSFKLEGQSLSLGGLAATEMACPEPEGLMQQEAAYLAVLAQITGYRMEGAGLSLLNADGIVLAEFTRAP